MSLCKHSFLTNCKLVNYQQEAKPSLYTTFTEKIYCHCKQPDFGERMKQCDSCANWFHMHCEYFESNLNSKNNSSLKWYYQSCVPWTSLHINLLPHLVLDKIFFELCVADERMHSTLALVCKKWSFFISEKFVERVSLE